MRSASRLVAAVAAAAALVSGVVAIQKVSRTGRYLYTGDGNRFYIKGVAYQEQGPLPLIARTSQVQSDPLFSCRPTLYGSEQPLPRAFEFL